MITIEFKLVIISALLLLALVSDIKTYRIKNLITYGFMFVGLTANFAAEGFEGLVFSLRGIIIPAVCLFILYFVRAVGAGDIKLISAIGAVMGAAFALHASICSFICGGFIASCIILARHNGAERFKYLLLYIKGCLLSGKMLEYTDFTDEQETGRFYFSVAVAAGTAAAFIVHGSGLSIF